MFLSKRFHLFFCFLFASAFALAYFNGIEASPGYFGNAYKVLHPESFPGDMYVSFGRFHLWSVYYIAVRLAGDLWLDDRFILVLYWLNIFAALIGLDKVVRTLGLKDLWGRAVIPAILLSYHWIHDNQSIFVFPHDFNHTALSATIHIWLFYFLLSGKKTVWILLMLLLFILTSIKNSWLPSLIVFSLLWKERWGKPWKIATLCAFLLLIAGGLFYYYFELRRPTDPLLFDFLLSDLDNSEANPFYSHPLAWRRNLLFGLLMSSVYFLRLPDGAVQKRVRWIAGWGIFLWLAAGIYFTFAPDLLKIPYLLPLNFTRALWWSQVIGTAALAVFLLLQVQRAPTWKKGLFFSLLLLVLHSAPFTFSNLKPIGVILVLFPLFLVVRRFRFSALYPALALAFCLATLGFLGVRSVRNIPHFQFLMRHGVMGGNRNATWVGVTEYIREHTPKTATILAFAFGGPRKIPDLGYDDNLRVRTGRTMLIGHRAIFLFDYEKLLWHEREWVPVWARLQASLQARDFRGWTRGLEQLKSPDYLILPKSEAGWLLDWPSFPYRQEGEVNGYLIWKSSKLASIEKNK